MLCGGPGCYWVPSGDLCAPWEAPWSQSCPEVQKLTVSSLSKLFLGKLSLPNNRYFSHLSPNAMGSRHRHRLQESPGMLSPRRGSPIWGRLSREPGTACAAGFSTNSLNLHGWEFSETQLAVPVLGWLSWFTCSLASLREGGTAVVFLCWCWALVRELWLMTDFKGTRMWLTRSLIPFWLIVFSVSREDLHRG